jgi:hypothetical protein
MYACCGRSQFQVHRIPDYTDPVHYCALMDWMRDGGRWSKFTAWYKKTRGLKLYIFLELQPKTQVNLIAEAIEAGVLK